MYLVFEFPSNTNEQWFLDFMDTEYSAIMQNMYREGSEVHLRPEVGVEWMEPHARQQIVEQAEYLGAIVRECK